MTPLNRVAHLSALLMASGLMAACASLGGSKSEAPAPAPAPTAAPAPASTGKPAPASAAKPAAAPAAAPAPAATGSKIGPGMNERGEVVDSKKAEAGYGAKVKGIDDWEGEITGKPAPGSKFSQLKIGMPMQQVVNLVGQPSDQGAYLTGKAFIPFYFGSDRHRYEMVYKGQGRLIFASQAGGGYRWGGNELGGNLIWIIHSANEQGSR